MFFRRIFLCMFMEFKKSCYLLGNSKIIIYTIFVKICNLNDKNIVTRSTFFLFFFFLTVIATKHCVRFPLELNNFYSY